LETVTNVAAFTTILGFIITVWLLIQTRSAARRAKDAAQDARDAIDATTSLVQVGDCTRLGVEILEALRNNRNETAMNRIQDLTRVLIQLKYYDLFENNVSMKRKLNEHLKAIGVLREDLSVFIEGRDQGLFDKLPGIKRMHLLGEDLANWEGLVKRERARK